MRPRRAGVAAFSQVATRLSLVAAGVISVISPTPRIIPQRSTPIEQPISQTVALFATDYFSHWSDTNVNALSYFRSVYAKSVEFYGKPISRDILLEQKWKFAGRWPERIYTVRPATIIVNCDNAAETCLLEGIVDWDARNPELSLRSVGSASFSLKVSVQHDRLTILSESGSVISRGAEEQ